MTKPQDQSDGIPTIGGGTSNPRTIGRNNDQTDAIPTLSNGPTSGPRTIAKPQDQADSIPTIGGGPSSGPRRLAQPSNPTGGVSSGYTPSGQAPAQDTGGRRRRPFDDKPAEEPA